MAGSAVAVEARHSLPAVGGVSSLCLWGATICFLPASFMDAGRVHQRHFSVDDRIADLRMDCAGAGRRVDVSFGATVVRPARCDVRRRPLRGESIPSRDCLLA